MSVETTPSELFPGCTETAVFLDDEGNDCAKAEATVARIIVTDAAGNRVHEVHAVLKKI